MFFEFPDLDLQARQGLLETRLQTGKIMTELSGDETQATTLQEAPAHVASPNSGGNLAGSVDTAAATWLHLIHRYFQVNCGPTDQPDRHDTTIV